MKPQSTHFPTGSEAVTLGMVITHHYHTGEIHTSQESHTVQWQKRLDGHQKLHLLRRAQVFQVR